MPDATPTDSGSQQGAPTARQRLQAWAFVAAQAVLIVALILLPGGQWVLPDWLQTVGRILGLSGIAVMIVGALGLGRALTPLPLPNGAGDLRTGGLYRLVRHPIYTGLLMFAVGQVLSDPSFLRLTAAVLLIALIAVKARWEERRLAEQFSEYPDYAALTPRFIPSPRLLLRGQRASTTQP
jgi:protein-S-isoprenylcysteine O-methyltransferase Ste14